MTTTDDITRDAALALVDRFFRLEGAGDTAAQRAMLTSDFALVGPLGFVLDQAGWTTPRTSGDLAYHRLDWTDADARTSGDLAIVIGTQDQRASYQGNDASGRFHVTVIVMNREGRPLIAGMHFSPIADAPGR